MGPLSSLAPYGRLRLLIGSTVSGLDRFPFDALADIAAIGEIVDAVRSGHRSRKYALRHG